MPQVHEVQYSLPNLDRQFLRRALSNPEGASGKCGALRVANVTSMGKPGSPHTTYANNELGIHRRADAHSQLRGSFPQPTARTHPTRREQQGK